MTKLFLDKPPLSLVLISLLSSFLALLALLLFNSVLCLRSQAYNVLHGETVARNLMPPEYPGSTLIEVEQERHPNIRSEYRTYYTPDDIQTVLAYMEEHLPGFIPIQNGRYLNHIEDKSLTSTFVKESCSPLAVLQEYLPGFIPLHDGRYAESRVPGIVVELDDADDGGTEIKITLYSPDT